MVELPGADTKLMAHLTILIASKWRLPRDAQRRIPGWTDDQSNFDRFERDVATLASLRRRADALDACDSSSATGRGRRVRADD